MSRANAFCRLAVAAPFFVAILIAAMIMCAIEGAVAGIAAFWDGGRKDAIRIIYLVGPITGRMGNNFHAFDDAAELIREWGFFPISPADIARASGVGAHDEPTADQSSQIQQAEVLALAVAHAIYVLPGWRTSKGSRREIAVADARGIPVASNLAGLIQFAEGGLVRWNPTEAAGERCAERATARP